MSPPSRTLPVAMFFASFAWAFVFVSLPFHIQKLSPLDPTATLRWTGVIVGVSPLLTVITGPLWGRWAGGRNPRAYYVAVEVLQGVGFFGMALARSLTELFLARLLLGVMGASSTFAFVMAGRAGDGGAVRRQVATIQSAMTVGQVIGPLAGAMAAQWFGFQRSFVVGGLILLGCAALVRWGVVLPPEPAPTGAAGRRVSSGREVWTTAAIVLLGSTQVFFLTAVLPQILAGLGVPEIRQLDSGGFLIFVSGAAAAVGALAAPRLVELTAERTLVAGLLAISSASLAALAAAPTLAAYTAGRFLQVLAVAPVFPLVVARIAQGASGQAIGIVNSARIAAAFVGPMIATSVLAWASPGVLHLVLAALGLLSVPLALRAPGRARSTS